MGIYSSAIWRTFRWYLNSADTDSFGRALFQSIDITNFRFERRVLCKPSSVLGGTAIVLVECRFMLTGMSDIYSVYLLDVGVVREHPIRAEWTGLCIGDHAV